MDTLPDFCSRVCNSVLQYHEHSMQAVDLSSYMAVDSEHSIVPAAYPLTSECDHSSVENCTKKPLIYADEVYCFLAAL